MLPTNESIRLKELAKEDLKEEQKREERRKNKDFTQTYPRGWKRIRELSRDKKTVVTVALYSFFAENIDPTCGAVICDQAFIAEQLGVTVRTIQRWLDILEEKNAIIRIPVAGKVCAYALDPHEVWKGYDTSKPYAAFVTKTLVNKDGDIQRRIMSMFNGKDKNKH